VYAKDLTAIHYLAVPRTYAFSSRQVIDVQHLLGSLPVTFQTPWKLSGDDMQQIMELSTQGKTSREIGEIFGKSGSYIRHLRGKIRDGHVHETKTAFPNIENGFLRFPNERQPGIPLTTKLGLEMAELLGYYCAEGSIAADNNRPNSHDINFSFSKKETELASRVVELLHICFGINAQLVNRQTTLAVSVSKASLALLFTSLTEKSVQQPFLENWHTASPGWL
jgi:hypothetical protein